VTVQAKVFTKRYILGFLVTQSAGEYVARLSSIRDASGQNMTQPILIGAFRGTTPGAALDAAFASAKNVFEIDK
jgi:hypothetical protein